MANFDRQLVSIYLLTATLMVGYGAIFSLLAEIRNSFGLTSAGIGFIGAAAFASGFVAQLFLSRFADAGHGSLMMQTGLIICIASTLWMIFADSLTEWILSRGALGFGSGIVRPAIRRYIVLKDPASAGRSLGVLTAYETAGFLVGPVIAAILNTTLGLGANFVVLAILLALFTPFVFTLQITGSVSPPERGILIKLICTPTMQSCLAMGIAFWITIGVFEAIWAVFLSDLGASQIFIGLTMSLFGIPMIFISPWAGELAQRRGTLNIATASIGVSILCMFSYGFIENLWLLCLPLLIHALADAYTMPATQLAVTQASGQDAIATGQGLFGAVGMAVGAATAALSGILYEQSGAAGLWGISGTLMILLMIFAWWRGAQLR